MAEQFTPGPWHVEMDPETDAPRAVNGKYAVADSGGDTVFETAILRDACMGAAAPELLAACQDVEEAWAGSGDMATAIDAVLLAIAKATGKTP